MIYNDKSLTTLDSEFRKRKDRILPRPSQAQSGRPSISKKPKIRMPIYNNLSTSLVQENLVMPEQFFDKKKFDNPENNLIYAVLEQAFADLRGSIIAMRIGGSDRASKVKLDKLQELRDWFVSEEISYKGGYFSFEFICQHLEYDVYALRTAALDLYDKHPFCLSIAEREEQLLQEEEARKRLLFTCYINHRVEKDKWRAFLASDGPDAYFCSVNRKGIKEEAMRRLYDKGIRGKVECLVQGTRQILTMPEFKRRAA